MRVTELFHNLEREESFEQTPHPWKGCALPLELFPRYLTMWLLYKPSVKGKHPIWAIQQRIQ